MGANELLNLDGVERDTSWTGVAVVKGAGELGAWSKGRTHYLAWCCRTGHNKYRVHG